jgi:hypothetical protein
MSLFFVVNVSVSVSVITSAAPKTHPDPYFGESMLVHHASPKGMAALKAPKGKKQKLLIAALD